MLAGHDPHPSAQLRIAILGAGGQAAETAGYCVRLGRRVVAFVEEHDAHGDRLSRDPGTLGAPVISFGDPSLAGFDCSAVTAVGSSEVRRRFVDNWPGTFEGVVDGSAWLSEDVRIGTGVTIAPRAVLNRSVTIGSHVLINVGAVLSHDVVVGDFATIAPGVTLGGAVSVGVDAFVGIGATVIDHVQIGRGAIVGAGAVVIGDVPEHVTVVGVPARPVTRRSAR